MAYIYLLEAATSSLLEALCRHSHAHLMRPLPLLFGIWHAYKHAVVSCHRRFGPWFTALQFSSFLNEPGHTTVYYFAKLSELERIMLAVFHAAGNARLERARADTAQPARAPQKVQRIKKRLQSLLVLILRFIPATIKLGILLRACTCVHRNPGTGRYACQLMPYALLLILSLRGDAHDEYVNALFLGSAVWNYVHDALQAAVFVEECCESLLFRLSCITTKDKAARSVKDFASSMAQSAYIHTSGTNPCASPSPRSTQDCQLPAASPWTHPGRQSALLRSDKRAGDGYRDVCVATRVCVSCWLC